MHELLVLKSPTLRKFISPLPALGTGIPIASANTSAVPGVVLLPAWPKGTLAEDEVPQLEKPQASRANAVSFKKSRRVAILMESFSRSSENPAGELPRP
jgi:hypothetical protein